MKTWVLVNKPALERRISYFTINEQQKEKHT